MLVRLEDDVSFFALVPLFPVCAQEPLQGLSKFLQERIGLSTNEINNVERGEVVAKVLPSESQEVAVFGVVLVNAPVDFFLEKFRDIESYKKGTSVPLVEKFSNPPGIEDLNQLEIDKADLAALKSCKIGDCDVKLSAAAIARLRNEINWNSPNATQQVNQLARAALLEYVKQYLAGGNMALSEYNDKKKTLRVADDLIRF